jgi:hypothetical protein
MGVLTAICTGVGAAFLLSVVLLAGIGAGAGLVCRFKPQAREDRTPSAPAPGHGGHLACLDIWACGRTVTLNTQTGRYTERPGRSMCPECHPVPETDWDAALRDLRS